MPWDEKKTMKKHCKSQQKKAHREDTFTKKIGLYIVMCLCEDITTANILLKYCILPALYWLQSQC